MLYRSLGKILYANGKVVTQHIDKYDEELVERFNYVSPEDEEAGYIYVLKSEDGGDTWSYQYAHGSSKYLYDIHFIDSNTGWAVGNGTVMYTTDGGANWVDKKDKIFFGATGMLNDKTKSLLAGVGINFGIYTFSYGFQYGNQDIGFPQIIDISFRLP